MTASVTPAPSPAALNNSSRASVFSQQQIRKELGRRTKENHGRTSLTSFFVRKETFVLFETCEPDRHLRYDTGNDSSQSFVKTHRRFFADNVSSSREETTSFSLSSDSVNQIST